jgi:hypothetical protein
LAISTKVSPSEETEGFKAKTTLVEQSGQFHPVHRRMKLPVALGQTAHQRFNPMI